MAKDESDYRRFIFWPNGRLHRKQRGDTPIGSYMLIHDHNWWYRMVPHAPTGKYWDLIEVEEVPTEIRLRALLLT